MSYFRSDGNKGAYTGTNPVEGGFTQYYDTNRDCEAVIGVDPTHGGVVYLRDPSINITSTEYNGSDGKHYLFISNQNTRQTSLIYKQANGYNVNLDDLIIWKSIEVTKNSSFLYGTPVCKVLGNIVSIYYEAFLTDAYYKDTDIKLFTIDSKYYPAGYARIVIAGGYEESNGHINTPPKSAIGGFITDGFYCRCSDVGFYFFNLVYFI